MNNSTSILLQLKDIHQPAAISWWPLAPGWYGLMLAVMVIFLFLSMIALRAKYSRRRLALAQLSQIQQDYSQNPNIQHAIAKLSQLLKQALLFKYPRQEIVSLYDECWLQRLDQVAGNQEYTQGCGRLLISLAYMPPVHTNHVNIDELLLLVKQTLKRCL